MSQRKCLSLALVILIYAYLVRQLLADFQDDLDPGEVQHFFRNVQQKNLTSNCKREGQRNFSNPCSGHIYEFINSLLRKEIWALKMFDAASKIPSGILDGNINDFGMYDECLAIQENKNGTKIHGRHCMYKLGLKLNVSEEYKRFIPRLSVCVPSTCNNKDVTHLLELIIFKVTNISSIGINSVQATCSRIEPLEWTPGSITALSVIGAIILFLLACTFIDILQKQLKPENNFIKTLSQFSVQRSALQILNMKINPASFPVLNGIRFLSMCWVIMGHAYKTRGTSIALVNKRDAYEWIFNWHSVYVTLSLFAVDSFFTLSGFLMSYLFIKEISKGGKFNIFSYYLHRYLRLTPAMGMLIIFQTFIVPHIGSGPIWKDKVSRSCTENWWPTILYLQNFVRREAQCLGHLWYLAVDMQLFWFSPIILYPLSRKPKLGLAILAASFVASLVSVAIITANNKYSFDMLTGDTKRKTMDIYAVPHTRAGPWLVGIFFGYITISKEVNLNRVTATFGWICAIIGFVYCALGYKFIQKLDYKYNLVWEIIFSTTARSMWGLGLCWIIFASIKSYGGPVAKFLSLPIFLPLARLSYCIYLVHQVWQKSLINTEIVNSYFSDFVMFRNFLDDVIISIVLAFFFSLFFESPMMILEKLIFRRKKIEPKKELLEDDHNG